jgi:hypothetical protein
MYVGNNKKRGISSRLFACAQVLLGIFDILTRLAFSRKKNRKRIRQQNVELDKKNTTDYVKAYMTGAEKKENIRAATA